LPRLGVSYSHIYECFGFFLNSLSMDNNFKPAEKLSQNMKITHVIGFVNVKEGFYDGFLFNAITFFGFVAIVGYEVFERERRRFYLV